MHCALNLPDEVINGDDRIKDPSIIDGNLDKAELELNKIHDVPLINGNVYAERSKVHIGPNIYTDKAVVVQYPYSAKKDEFEPYGFCDIIQTPPKKTDNDNKVFIQDNEKFKIKRRYLLYGAVIFILIAVVTTLVTIFLLPTSKDGTEEDDVDKPLKIVERGEWFALPPSEVIVKLEVTPAPYVVIFEAPPSACFTITVCSNYVRFIQGDHLQKGYGDIGFHWLIGGDGAAYKGLGWDLHGAHTYIMNNRSISVAFFGYFRKDLPVHKQINAFWKLMKIGVDENKIIANYTIFTHSDITNSTSPGKAFNNLVKKWPHYKKYDPAKDVPPYTFE